MMISELSVKRAFNRSAATYDQAAHLQRTVLHSCARMLTPHTKAGDRVLDAGCGTGNLSEWSREENRRWNIIGLDMAESMLRVAESRGIQHAVAGTLTAMPFADNCMDNLLCSLAVQWSDKPWLVFKDAARVLKPGGYAVFSTFGPGTLKELALSFTRVDGYPHVSAFATLPALQVHAEQAGLTWRHADSETIIDYSESAKDIMRRLRQIGASNKRADRRRGMTTPRMLAAMDDNYRHVYGTPSGLPATWEILYFLLQKPRMDL